MYVKFNLLLICAVLLNYGECNKCEDVYNCVSDWIAAALSSSTNVAVDTIRNVPVTTTSHGSDEGVLTDLTQFLKDKFFNLFREGELVEVVGNKTKIYVQTFKINDSIFENIPNIKFTTVKSDLIDNDYSEIIDYNQNNNFKPQYFNSESLSSLSLPGSVSTEPETKITTTFYWVDEDFLETSNQYNASIENESVVEATTDKQNENYSAESQHLSNATVNITSVLTTASTYFNTEGISTIQHNISIKNESIFETTTGKPHVTENSYSINNHDESYSKKSQYLTYAADIMTTTTTYFNTVGTLEVQSKSNATLQNATFIEITTIKSDFVKIDDSNNNNSYIEADNTTLEIGVHVADRIDGTSKTTTLTSLNSNDNPPKTFEMNVKHSARKDVDTQRNEISFNDDDNTIHESDNEIVGDNLTDYLDIDYIDVYKDTTNENVEYKPFINAAATTEAVKFTVKEKLDDEIESAYPWIATLFIMDTDSKQFEYVCDGVLLSDRVVLTAARCVNKSNATVDAGNILVILGKRSLQAMGPNEVVSRVKSIKLHENFIPTEGKVENDLAVAVLAERVSFNADIQPAPLGVKDTSAPLQIATTGWHVTGPLQPLYLELQTSNKCIKETDSKNIVCSKLGDIETTCPSYGGVLIVRQDDNKWRLKGIATGNPMNGGVCFNKDLAFTKLGSYLEWIMKTIRDTSK